MSLNLPHASRGSPRSIDPVNDVRAESVFPSAPPAETGAVTPVVLLVADRIGEAGALAELLRASGLEVIHLGAADAERASRYVLPDVVVVDDDLVDTTAQAFIATLRGHASRLSAVPVVALVGCAAASVDEPHGRIAGADLCLSKRTRVADVVVQVGALIRLSMRCRLGAASLDRPRAARARLCSGDLAQISAVAFLTLLEMERQSGVLEVITAGASARFDVVRGRLAACSLDDEPVDALVAVGVVLGWSTGHFAFDASEPAGRDGGVPVGELIDAAVRLIPELGEQRRS
jgi:two-component system, OmpR family, response regulator